MRDVLQSAVPAAGPRSAAPPAIDIMTGARRGDHPPAPALVSVMRLLKDAGDALQSDGSEVYHCIEKAAAILQAELTATEPNASGSARSRGHQLAPWQVARVKAFIDANLAGAIAVEQLAALARLSTSYFSRAFRSTVGMPPCAYVIRRRVERAEEMIRLTAKPLSEIALDCGMADQAHLNKLFRRVVGMSPGAWRRLHGRSFPRAA